MVTSIPWPVDYVSSDPHNLGWYATELALTTAHPLASSGDFAFVGSTDTVWTWDADTSAWVDSGAMYPVDSVFGRVGAVIAQPSDYDASQVDNDSLVSGAFVDDALNFLAKTSIVRGYNAGVGAISKGTVVKISGVSVAAAPENDIPTVIAVTGIYNTIYGIAYAAISASTGGALITHGLLQGVLDTSTSAIGNPIYFTTSGVLSLASTGSPVIGYVASVAASGDVIVIVPTNFERQVKQITSVNTPYSASVMEDNTVWVNAAGGAVNVNLPDTTTCIGKEFTITATDVTNTVTITPSGVQTINGVAGAVTLVMIGTSLTLKAFGTNWQIS